MNPVQGSGPRRARLCTAGALAVGAGLGDRQAAVRTATLKVGHPAPPLVLHALSGRSIATDDLCGRMVILTFWAAWCDPYCTELPLLSAYAVRHADKGLRTLGFSLDEPVELPTVCKVAVKLDPPVDLLDSTYAGGYDRIWHLLVDFTVGRKGLLADNGWDLHELAWTTERLERVITPLLR